MPFIRCLLSGAASRTCACMAACSVCLVLASYFDLKDHKVPDIIWWVMALDSLFIPVIISQGTFYRPFCDTLPGAFHSAFRGFLHTAADPCVEQWFSSPVNVFDCLAVIAIQEKIMSRHYGRADSHAFSCCELFFFFLGFGAAWHILHMSVSLALLCPVQFFRKNIGMDLKLREPVAFIPYISVSFFITLFIIKAFHISLPYML